MRRTLNGVRSFSLLVTRFTVQQVNLLTYLLRVSLVIRKYMEEEYEMHLTELEQNES